MGDNYRLSICSIRGLVQKHGYIIESGGKTLESSVSSIEFAINLKKDLLSVLVKGLRSVKPWLQHDDMLYVEIPNQHLANWLNGRVEYKDYVEELDKVFEILETIDCRYKFMFVNSPYAREVVKNTKLFLNEGSSLIESFKDLN